MNYDKNIRFIEEHIGKQLREKRTKRGFTLASIANQLGVSHQQIQKYEQAQSRVSAAMLYKFSKLFGVGIEQFFTDIQQNQNCDNTEKQSVVIDTSPRPLLNILIIEDNPADETITRKALENLNNIKILCVHDGMQALEVLRYKTLCTDFPTPDLILLDVSIPKRDGISVLKEIKRDREIQNIPVVMLTNNVSSEVMMTSYKLGAAGYICKSFDYETFKDNLLDCVKYWSKVVVLP